MRRLFKRTSKEPCDPSKSTTPTPPRKTFPSGIKLLHDAEDSIVDIIFIHGLNGDREKTWTAKTADAPWPQTLLPSKVPNARVLTFGYDAYVTDWRDVVSKNRIGDHAYNLLTAVATYREIGHTNDRPIIFVCHSLGGLVCEDALSTARQRPEGYLKKVLHSTRGILFLGTPHHGSGLAQWGESLARAIGLFKQTNPEILAVLESDSEVLARIQDSFHTVIRSWDRDGLPPVEITCFFEELPLPGVGIVVPRHSAILPGYIPRGIRSNHMDMARFENASDPGFIDVAGELQLWVGKLAAPSNSGTFAAVASQRERAGQQQGRLFLVPYPSNPEFVGRSDILERVKNSLSASFQQTCQFSHARAVLFGLGGIGKTQIAIAYAYSVLMEHPNVSVFWVHASNAERFREAFSRIAEKCQIPGYNDPKRDVLVLVKSWLERDDQGPWLMIIDNADDTEMFFSSDAAAACDAAGVNRPASEGNLGRFIPTSWHGAVLVTSRNKKTGVKFAKGRSRNLIEVGPMGEEESGQLISKRLEVDHLDARQTPVLVSRLERLPLALVQAAAFIQENSLTVKRYIQLLDEGDNTLVELLSKPFEEEGRDSSIPNAVAATWIVSFTQIREQHPYAADLLSLMSFFDRQGIPKLFLMSYRQQGYEQGHRQEQLDQREGSSELDIALGVLKAFSFVSASEIEENFNIHRLIQLVMRKWLITKGEDRRWGSIALCNLSNLFPPGEYENWSVCLSYLPHVYAVRSHPNSGSTEEACAKATLLHHAALFMINRGQWHKAEELQVEAAETREKVLGAENLFTLASRANLALIYKSQSRWKEAEELYMQVIDIQKRAVGAEHPSTLASMNNLASIYRDQSRWREAEELFMQVIETYKGLSTEHPDMLASMNNLALTYREQGRWKKAEELLVQVIESHTRVLGAENPETLTCMGNLASTYKEQGQWRNAEELLVQVIESRKRVTSAEHPQTLTCMNELASIYREQGRWKEAEELFVQVVEPQKRELGAEHPETLASMNNLALTFLRQGQWKKAKELFVEVVETGKKALGTEHPQILTCMNNLATVFINQGQWKEAEQLITQVLETYQRVLSTEHPSTLIAMANLASTYRNQGRWKEAEELEMQLVETGKKVLGAEHPHTLHFMNNLALTWKSQDRDKEAIVLMKECIRLREHVLGSNHPSTSSSRANLDQWESENSKLVSSNI